MFGINSRPNPLVTIVIPSYNQGQFIESAINSILTQDYEPIEILVIDALSTDKTLDVLSNYGSKIQILREADKGHADGVNKGFILGSGEIFGWLNSDDVYFNRTSIRKIVKAFQDNPQMDIVYGDGAIISENNDLLRLWLVPNYQKSRIERNNMIIQPTVFFRRNVVKTERLILNCLALDYEFWLRLGSKNYSFLHINNLIAADRYHKNRVSTKYRSELQESALNLSQRYIKQIQLAL